MIRRTVALLPLALLLASCLRPRESETKALPFACGPENASEIYFDKEQINYLQPVLKQDGRLEELVVFGGSFSDSGQLGTKMLDALVPKCSYWNHRFSNGPNWNDYISGALGLTHRSYAVGGAETLIENTESGWKRILKFLDPRNVRDSAQDILLSPFPKQIDQWEKDQKKKPKDLEKTLFVIWVGPNDYLYHGKEAQDASGKLDDAVADELIKKVQVGIVEGVERLQKLGAKHIVLGNAPRLNDVVSNGKDPISNETYAYLTNGHNKALELLAEEKGKENLDISVFHAYERNEAVLADLNSFGFDSAGRCYNGGIAGYAPIGKRGFCSKPLRTKLWDDMHPNTRMHCLLAEQLVRDVGAKYGWSETSSIREACLQMRTKTGKE